MFRNASLKYEKGSSKKIYNAQIIKENDGFKVNFEYGRIGGTLKSGTKTVQAVDEPKAVKIFEKLVKSKIEKGYISLENNSQSKIETLVNKEHSGITPHLLIEIKKEELLSQYLEDDNFLLQEKFDGERLGIINGEACKGFNKKGFYRTVPKAIKDSIYDKVTLDGEIIGDTFYVWDILGKDGICLLKKPYKDRLLILEGLDFGEGVKVVETLEGSAKKKEYFLKMKSENKEGIVFKDATHLYELGRPLNKESALKFKFYKTATVMVTRLTEGKRSVHMGILNNGIQPVGRVTIPPNKEIPSVGDLIEVKYLYAYRDGCLYQPTYLHKRFDQSIEDISIDQLVYKN